MVHHMGNSMDFFWGNSKEARLPLRPVRKGVIPFELCDKMMLIIITRGIIPQSDELVGKGRLWCILACHFEFLVLCSDSIQLLLTGFCGPRYRYNLDHNNDSKDLI